jgi:hypothetical protein
MSVTFFVETIGTGSFNVDCGMEGPRVAAGLASYDAAREIATVHAATCEECACYRPSISEDQDVDLRHLEINMSNANSVVVLHELDLFHEGDELAGHEDGAAFLSRVLVALGTEREDAGVPAREGRSLPGMPRVFGDAHVIDGGRPAGYVTERLVQLHALALEAARLGRTVYWS